jgi:hypothetical protein
MDDNAASHDITISEVHPDTRAGANSNPNNEDKEREINDAVELLAKDDIVDDSGGTQDGDGQGESEIPPQPSASPPPAPPPIKSPTPEPTSTEPAQISTSTEEPERGTSSTEEPQTVAEVSEDTAPAPAQEDSNDVASQNHEQLFLNAGEDEEGLDPDTLANLAALSRLARDEGDGDEDDENEGVSGGDNDFSTLLGDSQHSMTREQMQDIVARLAQHGDDDQDAEGEDDLDIDAEGEDEYPEDRQDGDAVKQKREDSEDLREVDDQRGSKNEGGDTKSERSRKRKRNRTVL